MKKFPFFLFFFFISLNFFLTSAFSQQAYFLEQDEFSSPEKSRLIDYYLRRSKKFAFEGNYARAIKEAELVFNVDPENEEAALFIKRMKRRLDLLSGKKRETEDAGIEGASVKQPKETVERKRKGEKNVGSLGIGSISKKEFDYFFSNIKEAETKRLIGVYRGETEPNKDEKKRGKAKKKKKKIKLFGKRKKKDRKSSVGKDKSERKKDLFKEKESVSILDNVKAEKRLPEIEPASYVENDDVEVRGIGQIEQSISLAEEEFANGNYDTALFYVDEALALDPLNKRAMPLKRAILRKRREVYKDVYEKARRSKADLFREKNDDISCIMDKKALLDIEKHERLIDKLKREKALEEERRKMLAEVRIRDSVRKRLAEEERARIEEVSNAVDKSIFYKRFDQFEKKRREKELWEKQQINSLIIRTEALMEIGQYDEAMAYVNNIFAIDPENKRGIKLRDKLDELILNRKAQGRDALDKVFLKEKEKYLKVKKSVRKQKIASLLDAVGKAYDKGDYVLARKEAQKIIILEPKNRKAKRWIGKIDRRLEERRRKIAEEEAKKGKVRELAMSEAAQEAARAIELSIIDSEKSKSEIEKRVSELEYAADKKLSRYMDFTGALVDLNRAMAIDPGNKRIYEKIKRVRALQQKAVKKGKDNKEVVYEIRELITDKGISLPSIEKREDETAELARIKERKWEEFNRSKEIASAAVRKDYKRKVKRYVKIAEKYLEENKFEKAKKEVEKIFWFDKNNPTAKELLKRIEELEIEYNSKLIGISDAEDLRCGMKKENVKAELAKNEDRPIVRDKTRAVVEDREIAEKSVKRLIKEGKRLLKEKRYYEARQKFEAVFAIDPSNKKASGYLDKVKEAMLKEKECDRRLIMAERRKEINMRLDKYAKKIRGLQREGRYTDAAILIEKGLLLDPGNKYFLELKKVNDRGAKEELMRETSSADEKENLINLAIKEFIQGNYLESKKYFERVLEIDPNDEKAKNSIAKIDAKIEKLKLIK